MKLGLGTVQFGQTYGITNTRGQTPEREITRILDQAAEAGCRILDTAHEYGTSEEVLGKCLPSKTDFRIVTKTPVFKKSSLGKEEAKRLTQSYEESLGKLRQPALYALLIHAADDLLNPDGGYLFEAMEKLKHRGLAQKIGVSVYAPGQAEEALKRFALDIIQFPLNVLDRRFTKGGFLGEMKQRNIELHARSLFLQGILLSDPQKLPSFLSPLRDPMSRFRSLLKDAGLSVLQGVLQFVLSHQELDCALVGVAALEEFNEILAAAKNLPPKSVDWSAIPEPDADLIDPSRWPSAARILP